MSVSGAAETGPSPGAKRGSRPARLRVCAGGGVGSFWPTLLAALGSSAFVMVDAAALHRRRQGAARGPGELFHATRQGAGLRARRRPSTPRPCKARPRRRRRRILRARRSRRLDLMRKCRVQSVRRANSVSGGVDQRVVDKFLSRLTVFPVPRSHVLQIRVRFAQSRACGAGSERRGRRLSAVADGGEGARGESGERMAVAQDRGIARQSRRRRRQGRGVSRGRRPAGRRERADGVRPSSSPTSTLSSRRARSAASAAEAKVELLRRLEQDGRLDEAPAVDHRRRDAPPCRSARGGQDRRSPRRRGTLLPLHPRMKELNAQLAGARRADQGRRRAQRAASGKRGAARRRSGRDAFGRARPAIEDCRRGQRRRRALARARDGRQGRARPA